MLQSSRPRITRKQFESSAKRGNDVSFEIALGISLIKSKNSKGPKIEPCWAPDVTGRKSDDPLSITTLCLLLINNYDLNQANKDPPMQRHSSLNRSFSWDTRSKALEKSRQIASICCLLSRATANWWTTWDSWDTVHFPGRKPCCQWVRWGQIIPKISL